MFTLASNIYGQLRRILSAVKHSNSLCEYESASVQRTLDSNYAHPLVLDARRTQDNFILKRFKGMNLRIADIGCGDGYHAELFAPDCNLYHGYEISSDMVSKVKKKWRDNGLSNTKIVKGDAGKAELRSEYYDVVWSLYFTPGNFRDEFDSLDLYSDSYLDKNPAFIRIIKNFYNSLKLGGKMFLTVYKDKLETETVQRKFYKMTGQNVITPLGSRFVATKENFWSVRWTKRSMLSNLDECGINPGQVVFNDLNRISWIVEITKS